MFEQGAGELEPLFIPTFIVKDGVETLHDMAYLLDHATRAAGFVGFDGASYYSFDGKDLANSSQIEHVHFGQPPQGN
jgi:hypothetical protein